MMMPEINVSEYKCFESNIYFEFELKLAVSQYLDEYFSSANFSKMQLLDLNLIITYILERYSLGYKRQSSCLDMLKELYQGSITFVSREYNCFWLRYFDDLIGDKGTTFSNNPTDIQLTQNYKFYHKLYMEIYLKKTNFILNTCSLASIHCFYPPIGWNRFLVATFQIAEFRLEDIWNHLSQVEKEC
eukprot:snap_masked-scaffold_24-processed-gene-3.16-mRNA-1 protein AED:1.00 eAED:1.00 QI:0/0/0/0/1/1/2/0/186